MMYRTELVECRVHDIARSIQVIAQGIIQKSVILDY